MVSSAGTEPTERVCSAKAVDDAPPSEPTLLILLPYPSLTPRRPRPPLNTPPASCYADCVRTCVFACSWVAARRCDTDWSWSSTDNHQNTQPWSDQQLWSWMWQQQRCCKYFFFLFRLDYFMLIFTKLNKSGTESLGIFRSSSGINIGWAAVLVPHWFAP